MHDPNRQENNFYCKRQIANLHVLLLYQIIIVKTFVAITRESLQNIHIININFNRFNYSIIFFIKVTDLKKMIYINKKEKKISMHLAMSVQRQLKFNCKWLLYLHISYKYKKFYQYRNYFVQPIICIFNFCFPKHDFWLRKYFIL